jgi:uncharacterized protein (TIGR02328 family)
MRLWHKDLVPVLPRKQLVGQWRELCLIAKNISEHGTPNHILVNKVIDYPCSHLNTYAQLVYKEMQKRGMKPDWEKYDKWTINKAIVHVDNIFKEWHNYKYLTQCYYNLEEKHDCNGVNDVEWFKIHKLYMDKLWEYKFW